MMKHVTIRAEISPFNNIHAIISERYRLETIAIGNMIEQTVAHAFDITTQDLRAPTRRTAPIALARQVGMYLAHISCGMTLKEAGLLFCRDRTTAAHACRSVEDKRDDPIFDISLDCLETALRAWAQARRLRLVG